LSKFGDNYVYGMLARTATLADQQIVFTFRPNDYRLAADHRLRRTKKAA